MVSWVIQRLCYRAISWQNIDGQKSCHHFSHLSRDLQAAFTSSIVGLFVDNITL